MSCADRDSPPADDVGSLGAGTFEQHLGVVQTFDVDAGLGIVADTAGREWVFHCTTIVGGTRVIDPGVEVRFTVGAGGPGQFEAFEVAAIG